MNDQQIIDKALEILANKLARPEAFITKPIDAHNFLKLKIGALEHEVFGVLFLNNRHGIIKYVEMFRGTIDGAAIHPREVVKEALKHNAAAVIIAHNHPSGNVEPSRADRAITARLVDALNLIDIRVLDHIIVGTVDTCSFAERGLL